MQSSRRTFLIQVVAGLAPAFLGRVTAAGPNDRIRIGLIGCGGMGKGNLTAFLGFPEVDCPVICDVD